MVQVLFVANLHAGSHPSGCELDWIRWRLQALDYSVIPSPPVPEHGGDPAFQHLVNRCDLIVASGGDGTIRRLLPYLAFQPRPLAILPCGTGNDLARSLALPLDPLQAMDIALTGLRRRVDLARINGHFFVNVASLGISAGVSQVVDETMKRRLGTLAYRLAVARQVWRQPPLRLTLTMKGQRHRILAHQITIANGISFGGGWRVAANAALDDHVLDIVVVGPMAMAERWRRWRAREDVGLRGLLTSAHFRSSSCRIEARGPLTVNLDGDPVTLAPPLRVDVLPCALTVVVPAREEARSA